MQLPVRRLEMPTPYAVGPVNAYLIEAEPVTLVDCGVNTPEAQNALFLGLAAAGYAPQSIERVLVTHAHPDHYGLVHVLKELSGATVYFPERDLALVRDPQMLFEFGRLLLAAGTPLDLLLEMDRQREKSPRPKIDHDEVVPVNDSDRFFFEWDDPRGERRAFDFTALLMPGHTGGHVVYFEPQTRTMFAGDQLLPDTSPNPLLEPSVDQPGHRRRSLEEYLRSLSRMQDMEIGLVYPGHGAPVGRPADLIHRTIEHHERRKGIVAGVLGAEPASPYDVAMALYPRARGYDIILAVSEVIAHLDLVVADGAAAVEEREGVAYYRATPA